MSRVEKKTLPPQGRGGVVFGSTHQEAVFLPLHPLLIHRLPSLLQLPTFPIPLEPLQY